MSDEACVTLDEVVEQVIETLAELDPEDRADLLQSVLSRFCPLCGEDYEESGDDPETHECEEEDDDDSDGDDGYDGDPEEEDDEEGDDEEGEN